MFGLGRRKSSSSNAATAKSSATALVLPAPEPEDIAADLEGSACDDVVFSTEVPETIAGEGFRLKERFTKKVVGGSAEL